MTSSLEGEGGGLDTPQKWWRHLVMTWWQGGGGGVWIPPKCDDVIYEQPLTPSVVKYFPVATLMIFAQIRLMPHPHQIFRYSGSCNMVIAMKGASLHLGVAKTKEFTPTIFTAHIKTCSFSVTRGRWKTVRDFLKKKDRCLQAPGYPYK